MDEQHEDRRGSRRGTYATVLQRSIAGVPVAQVADRLCSAAVWLLDMDAGALWVLQGPQVSVPVGISGDLALVAEQLQLTAGEGPCWRAYASSGPVLVDDLGTPGSPARRWWPVYVAAMALTTPWRGLVALPVKVRLGVPVVLVACSEQPLAAHGPTLHEWPAVVGALGEALEAATTAAAERPLWRTCCAVEGGSVDELAEQLLSGALTAAQVLGLPPAPR